MRRLRMAAKILLEELEAGYLEVCKVPGREGGYIRVCVSVNAEWYSSFCKQFMRSRRRYPKSRTFIKRCNTIAALKRIIRGVTTGVYAERLLPFVEEMMERMNEMATA